MADTTRRDQAAELKQQAAVADAVGKSNAAAAAATPDRDADRAAELERQAIVARSVHNATHDGDGNPLPLGGSPAGITLVEGRP